MQAPYPFLTLLIGEITLHNGSRGGFDLPGVSVPDGFVSVTPAAEFVRSRRG